MLLMDIDGLSTINLTHGRAYGDQLLKDIADLCNELEGVDTAYHVDHNHFALTLCVHTEGSAAGLSPHCGRDAGAVHLHRQCGSCG